MAKLYHIVFIQDDKASGKAKAVRTVTDVSISPATTKMRALALWPEMQRRGATTFVISEVDGAEIYRWQSEVRIPSKTIHETGGRARIYPLLRKSKLKV